MTGDGFKAARQSLHAGVGAMAQALDVDARTIRRWERSEWPVPRPMAILVRAAIKHSWIAKELGIDPEALQQRAMDDAVEIVKQTVRTGGSLNKRMQAAALLLRSTRRMKGKRPARLK